MEELVETLDEDWQEVGEWFITTIPDDFELTYLDVYKNPLIRPGEPSYYLKYTIVEERSGQELTNLLNATKIKQDIKKLKRRSETIDSDFVNSQYET